MPLSTRHALSTIDSRGECLHTAGMRPYLFHALQALVAVCKNRHTRRYARASGNTRASLTIHRTPNDRAVTPLSGLLKNSMNGITPIRQSGTALIEFSMAAVPILLIGLGSLEIAQWHHAKQMVSLALMQAARAGSTQHARPQAIAEAFEQALLPLYVSGSHSAAARMNNIFARRSAETASPPWQIEILSPSAPAYKDFADPGLAIGARAGLAAINNDYQAEQDLRKRVLGWPNGAGPWSGLSIFQANTLALRVTYPHEPILPGMKSVIKMLSSGSGTYADQNMAKGGYLPILQELALTMQSHPVDWPALENRKVIKHQIRSILPASHARQTCHGIWCPDLLPIRPRPLGPSHETNRNILPSFRPDAAAPRTSGTPGHASPDGFGGIPSAAPHSAAGNSGPAQTDSPADPACGLTLCCIE